MHRTTSHRRPVAPGRRRIGAGLAVAATAAALAAATDHAATAAAATGSGTVHARHLSGWASFGPTAPIRGGVVSVRTLSGRSLLARGTDRTSGAGTWDVAVRALPERFVVSVRGGRAGATPVRGTVSALVTRGEARELVVVSPLSQLIADRTARHGSRPRAEREVRRQLGLGATYDPADIVLRAGPFDGRRYLAGAHRAGGIGRFSKQLAAASPRRGVRFPAAPRAGASALISAGDVAKGIVGGAAGQAVGQLLKVVGFGSDPNTARLRELDRQVRELAAKVDVVNDRLVGLQLQLAQAQYTQAVSTLGLTWIGSGNDAIRRQLAWLIANAAYCDAADRSACFGQLAQDRNPLEVCRAGDAGAATTEVTRRVCDVVRRLHDLQSNPNVPELQGRLLGVAGADGVLTSYQKLLFAQVTPNGFLTPSYRERVVEVIDGFAWKTALLATYQAEYARAVTRDEWRLPEIAEQAARSIAEQEALTPRRIPADGFIDPATNTLWAALPNAGSVCGGRVTGHRLLWWHRDDDQVIDREACAAQHDRAVAALGGVDGWQVPTGAALRRMHARWTASRRGTLGEWLGEQAGLPALRGLDRAFTPIAPNKARPFNGHLVKLTGKYRDNPGTAAGLATSDCRRTEWTSGMPISLWSTRYAAQVNGWFCDYLRLDRAAPTTARYCVRAFQWVRVRTDLGLPCDFPIATERVTTTSGFGKFKSRTTWPSSGPLDFGHPLVFLMERPLGADEVWFRSPA